MYLEKLARYAKTAADASEAFVLKSIDEAGYDFGYDLDDAPMDLEQLGEAAAKLCNALKKTGRVVYVGCNVRPKVGQKVPTTSPVGTAGTAGAAGAAGTASTASNTSAGTTR